MRQHRNTQLTVSNNPPISNFSPADARERLYVEQIEVEALAYAAGEAVTELRGSSNQRRVRNRLHTLVTKTATEATRALALGEQPVSALSAHMARAASAKRELEGRAG